MHLDMFENDSLAQYPFHQTVIKTELISTGAQSVNLDQIFTGPLPQQVFCFMVDESAFSGDAAKNPFEFKNNGLNYFNWKVDGVNHPSEVRSLIIFVIKKLYENYFVFFQPYKPDFGL